MSTNITIIDYGIGNLFNLQRAFEHLGFTSKLVSDCKSIKNSDRLLLPGVGAFGEGINNLNSLEITDAIKEFSQTGKTLMGICLGMQLLFSHSEELGSWDGLDIIQGKVRRFDEGSWKLPQITWNTLSISNNWDKSILDNIPEEASMYFNHSYYVKPDDTSLMLASTQYANIKFASVVRKENVFGCQFHPERSGSWGLKLLSNFAKLNF